MSIKNFDELTPEAGRAVKDFLRRIGQDGADADLVADLTDHLRDRLSPGDDLASTTALLNELSPESAPEAPKTRSILGRFPHDFRLPTAERIKETWWDPTNPHVLVPRVFGAGWGVNLGAVAVRMGLIEPDAEDEAFTETPPGAFRAALVAPVALAAGLAATYLALRGRLPDAVATHWDLAGQVDREAPRGQVAASLIAASAIPTAWAAGTVVLDRAPARQAGALAGATFAGALSASVWGQVLLTSLTRFRAWWLGLAGVLIGLAAPLAVLLQLARAGRAAEIARDLED